MRKENRASLRRSDFHWIVKQKKNIKRTTFKRRKRGEIKLLKRNFKKEHVWGYGKSLLSVNQKDIISIHESASVSA